MMIGAQMPIEEILQSTQCFSVSVMIAPRVSVSAFRRAQLSFLCLRLFITTEFKR